MTTIKRILFPLQCLNICILIDIPIIWDKIQPANNSYAEVAELADALRSGRSESNLMRVQVPPSAHYLRLAEKRVFCFHDSMLTQLLEYANSKEQTEPPGAKEGSVGWYNCTKSSTCFFN